MQINNVHLWSTFVWADFFFFPLIPPALYLFSSLSVEDVCISCCSLYDVQIFQWMNGRLTTKGNRRVFHWEWSASPLNARLSFSRSCCRSLHSHVCRQPLEEELRRNSAQLEQREFLLCFVCVLFFYLKDGERGRFSYFSVLFYCYRHEETRSEASKVAVVVVLVSDCAFWAHPTLIFKPCWLVVL